MILYTQERVFNWNSKIGFRTLTFVIQKTTQMDRAFFNKFIFL